MLIIGAGFSGLAVAGAFARYGIAYDQLEADSDLGGNWLHGVYDSVHLITSRRATQLDEWPMPVDWPDFPSKAQMLEYLRSYAAQFQLRPSIEFNRRVQQVSAGTGGRWHVDGNRDVQLRLWRSVQQLAGQLARCAGGIRFAASHCAELPEPRGRRPDVGRR